MPSVVLDPLGRFLRRRVDDRPTPATGRRSPLVFLVEIDAAVDRALVAVAAEPHVQAGLEGVVPVTYDSWPHDRCGDRARGSSRGR